MAKKKFARDMDRLLERLSIKTDTSVMEQLKTVCKTLIELNQRRLVKINHSVMEVICAKHLLEQGYQVMVEHPLESGHLSADVFAICMDDKTPEEDVITKKGETLLIEVETGFVPPEGALNPALYRQARITTKIARYSGHANKFALATPNYHVVQVPNVLLSPPDIRSQDELQELKGLCDSYYFTPPITLEDLARVELDAIYILNVDFDEVISTTPDQYLETVLRARGWA
jgi:hypothetical protein